MTSKLECRSQFSRDREVSKTKDMCASQPVWFFQLLSAVLIKDYFSLQVLSHVCLHTITYRNTDDNYSSLWIGLNCQLTNTSYRMGRHRNSFPATRMNDCSTHEKCLSLSNKSTSSFSLQPLSSAPCATQRITGNRKEGYKKELSSWLFIIRSLWLICLKAIIAIKLFISLL